MQIYIEYVIADNMAVSLFLIYATVTTLRRKFSKPRASIASSASTAFAVISPLYEIKAMLLAKILLALVTAAVILRHKDAKSYFRCLGVYLIYSFIAGGICMALLGSDDGFVALSNPAGYAPAVVAFSAFVCVFIAKKATGYITLARREKKYSAEVRLEVAGQCVYCKGFWDSGNRLFYKGVLPVVISGAGFARSIPDIDKAEKVEGIRLSTVAGNRTINGFIADRLTVRDGDGEREFDNVIIGIGERDFKDFSLLLNCDL